MWAIIKDYVDIAAALLEAGADTRLRSKVSDVNIFLNVQVTYLTILVCCDTFLPVKFGNDALAIARQFGRGHLEQLVMAKREVFPSDNAPVMRRNEV